MKNFPATLAAFGLTFWMGMCLASAVPSSMVASFYDCYQPGQCSRSKVTASGERFNPHGMTAAHKTLPFGTRLKVCLRSCVVVRVNDRGPFVAGRSLDLSRGAAQVIGLSGVARVRVFLVEGL